MEIIRSGFDKLELALNTQTPIELAQALEPARERAKALDRPQPVVYNGVRFMVRGNGTSGGYAFSCDAGRMAANWFFKDHLVGGGWSTRISVRALPLALNGIEAVKADLEKTIAKLGLRIAPNGISISRVDFAVDLVLPNFTLTPENFVVHSNTNKARYLEPDEMHAISQSWRDTSVRVGGISRKQIAVYDKAREVRKMGKVEWHQIWDAAVRTLGRPPLTYKGPDASPIWRVELRAGKDYLKDGCNVRGWRSLFDAIERVMLQIMASMRYTSPSGDSNRGRWPNHPLWDLVAQEVQERITQHVPTATPEAVLAEKRSHKIEQLLHQFLGLSVSLAALENVSSDQFDAHLLNLSKRAAGINKHHIRPLELRIARAAEKHADLCDG